MDVYDERQGYFPTIGPPRRTAEDMARVATAAPLADENQLDMFRADCQRRIQARQSSLNQRETF